MLLTLQDILVKEFDQAKGGFDTDQVTAFRREVADLVELAQAELRDTDATFDVVESRAREAEHRASEAEARADRAEVRASEAEARASEAEVRASEAEARLEEALRREEPEAREGVLSIAADAPPEVFARLGTRVTTVLQAAEDQAASITADAMTDAELICQEAEDYDCEVRGSADEYDRRVRRDADAYARFVTDDALRRATERLEAIVAESMALGRRSDEVQSTVLGRIRDAAANVASALAAFEDACGARPGLEPPSVERLLLDVRGAAPLSAELAHAVGVTTATTPNDGTTSPTPNDAA